MEQSQTILNYLRALWVIGDVREARLFNSRGFITYGYFDSSDKMARVITPYVNTHEIYITLNPVKKAALARAANRVKEFRKGDATTSDKDIAEVRYILVDVDPDRPSKISASQVELDQSHDQAMKIVSDLGTPVITAMSGNGYHLIYRYNWHEGYTPDGRPKADKLKGWLQNLAQKYTGNGSTAKVDTSVYNPARITKIIGTWARKGDNIQDRPHRQSFLMHVADNPTTIDITDITQAQPVKVEVKPDVKSAFDIGVYLSQNNIVVSRVKPWEGGLLYILDQCVFDHTHNQGEASIIQCASGVLLYQCHHDSCQDYKWVDVRDRIEGPRQDFTRPCRDCGQSLTWVYGDKRPRDLATKEYHQCAPTVPKQSSKKRRITTDEYIKFYQEKGWGFRLSELLDDIYLGDARLDDIGLSRVKAAVRDWCIASNYVIDINHATDAVGVMASRNRFHPVKDYLGNLPSWDGTDRITKLADHFTPPEQFRRWLEVWLAGAVNRAFTGQHHPMLVLAGPQEIGKSFFARWLCPVDGLYNDAGIHPDNKDCKIRLLNTWIWEVGELGASTRRSDIDALKAFLSLEIVRERKPYGHFDIVKPALSSFIGTVNSDFLIDRTGNRRFLTVALKEIDWAYAEIDKDQLWAQAMAASAKKKYVLTRGERLERDYINQEHVVADPVEIFLDRHYDITGMEGDFIVTSALLALLREEGVAVTRATSMAVAEYMKEGGAVAVRKTFEKGTRRARGFLGVKRITCGFEYEN